MRILGIETATRIGSVGLVEDGEVVAERCGPAVSGDARAGHGGVLASLVGRALADAGWSPQAVDVVAVSIGPGSFTGLRVGVGLAKGMVYAVGAALVPVATLDALAAVAGGEPGELVCPMLDARKGEVYASLYRVCGEGELEPLTETLLVRPDTLLKRVDGRCRFVGDAVDTYGGAIERALGGALVLPFSHYHPRGSVVAQLAIGRAALGAGALGALEPRYVRPAYVQVGKATGHGPPRAASRAR